ncbi:MAG: hypothetical protein ABEJ75_02615 [Candidatus Nanohaloarchaea archaeon]
MRPLEKYGYLAIAAITFVLVGAAQTNAGGFCGFIGGCGAASLLPWLIGFPGLFIGLFMLYNAYSAVQKLGGQLGRAVKFMAYGLVSLMGMMGLTALEMRLGIRVFGVWTDTVATFFVALTLLLFYLGFRQIVESMEPE